MRQRLSALLDGELDAAESRTLLSDIGRDSAMHAAWSEYRLIGDVLRAEPSLATDMTTKVMSALHDEPTILAPRPQKGAAALWRHGHHPAWALAASVSGVAVVAWLAFAPQATRQQASGDDLARTWIPASGVSPSPQASQVAASREMREYSAAHRPQARLVCLADEK